MKTIMDAFKVVAAVCFILLVFGLVGSCMERLSCSQFPSGTIIVIGGNSVKCP